MTEAEYREKLNRLEEQLTATYRERRRLQEAFAEDHPPVLPAARFRTDKQMAVSRCPRCGGRLDSDIPGAKICSDPDCSLPEDHVGLHVPLQVLWQEAGYTKGPWNREGGPE